MSTLLSSTAPQRCHRDVDGDVQMVDVSSHVQHQADTNMDEDNDISDSSTLVERHVGQVDADGDIEMTDAQPLDREDNDDDDDRSRSRSRTISAASSIGRTTEHDSIKSTRRWAETSATAPVSNNPAGVKSVSINVGLLRVQYDAEEGHVDIQGY